MGKQHGPNPNPPRDGDKKQARQRINVLVRTGRWPHPNTLPCSDCGDVFPESGHRHEYDHYLGYGYDHHYDVQPVCSVCQRMRSIQRGEIKIENLKKAALIRSENRKRFCRFGHPMKRFADGKWRCHECRLIYWRNRGKRDQHIVV